MAGCAKCYSGDEKMSDTKHFLRYIVPGSEFFIELGLLIIGFLPDWTYLKVKAIIAAENFDGGMAVGVAIGYVVTSGALGFLFNTIHHTFYWLCDEWYPAANYVGFVSNFAAGELPLPKGVNLPGGQGGRMNAWLVVNKLWHERTETNEKIKSANARAESFADIVHGLGSCRVALWSALLTALVFLANFSVVHWQSLDWSSYAGAGAFLVIVAVALPFIGGRAYKQTLWISDHFVIRVLDATLRADRKPSPGAGY